MVSLRPVLKRLRPRAEGVGEAGLFVGPWGEALRRMADLPTLYGAPSLAVEAGARRIVFGQQLENSADVALIDLKRG